MKTGPKPRPTSERLLEKIKRQNGCWVFQGAIGSSGYGKIFHSGKAIDAHRASWFAFAGDIPNGRVVMHTCDNKACVNPDHLKLGTQADNVRDMHEKRREARGKTLSEAIKRGWTPAKRKRRSKQSRERMLAKKRAAAKKAGVPVSWKYCPKCHEWMPLSGFGRNKARYDGVNSICNECRY